MHLCQKCNQVYIKVSQLADSVIFGTFEVGKAYRIDLKLGSTQMSKQLKLAFHF